MFLLERSRFRLKKELLNQSVLLFVVLSPPDSSQVLSLFECLRVVQFGPIENPDACFSTNDANHACYSSQKNWALELTSPDP